MVKERKLEPLLWKAWQTFLSSVDGLLSLQKRSDKQIAPGWEMQTYCVVDWRCLRCSREPIRVVRRLTSNSIHALRPNGSMQLMRPFVFHGVGQ